MRLIDGSGPIFRGGGGVWNPEGGGAAIPPFALVDEQGRYIVDEEGRYIVAPPTEGS